ncbi:unnamed protein product [Prorocentrum cordatum]|nr:unnamed protein product [Polarella glacialis]
MRCPGASWALRGAALLADLLAAASLRAVLLALLGRYPTSLGEDEAILERAEGPRRLAVSLRAREKRVLWAGLRAVGSELGAAFRGVLEAAAARPLGAEAQCAEVQGAVDAQRARVEEVFRQLWGPSLGDEEVTRASWVQASYYLFLCLHRLHEHPEAQQMALVPERWPGVPRGMGHGTSIAAAVEGNELLATYCEKMRMWGTYLVAQFLVTGRLSVEDTNTMSKESVSIRKQTAWSVPTAEALDCLARFTPLLELGAGSGLWARLLRGRGADVQARSLGRWSGRFGGAAGGAGPPEEGCSLEAAPALGVVAEGGPEAGRKKTCIGINVPRPARTSWICAGLPQRRLRRRPLARSGGAQRRSKESAATSESFEGRAERSSSAGRCERRRSEPGADVAGLRWRRHFRPGVLAGLARRGGRRARAALAVCGRVGALAVRGARTGQRASRHLRPGHRRGRARAVVFAGVPGPRGGAVRAR